MQGFEYLRPVSTTDEAVAVAAVLEESGIPCRILDEGGGPWSGRAGDADPDRVLVACGSFERAENLLKAREQALDLDDLRGDLDEGGDHYWNAPEAFAPFEGTDDKRPDELQPCELVLFGPFWILYFAAVLSVSAVLGYLLVSRNVGF